jgi:hypothetical protein
MGEPVESLEKPVVDRVLQAMAQAYPDPVDLYLLSMVMGCDAAALRDATAALVDAGLAQARIVADGTESRPETPCITDRGMAVACGYAQDAEDAAGVLARLETRTLRALLSARVAGSRMAAREAEELRASLETVSDAALIDAARVWAHQPVSDWCALLGVLISRGNDVAPSPAG